MIIRYSCLPEGGGGGLRQERVRERVRRKFAQTMAHAPRSRDHLVTGYNALLAYLHHIIRHNYLHKEDENWIDVYLVRGGRVSI